MKAIRKLLRAALLMAVPGLAVSVIAGNIVLVRQGGSDYPNDTKLFPKGNCSGQGVWTDQSMLSFTNVDDTFIVALTNAGHHVQAYWLNNANISDTDIASLNTNDCIILSYSINSGPMNQGNGAVNGIPCPDELGNVSTNSGHKWNTHITAPLILTKANLARAGAGRLGWFSSMSSNVWATTPLGNQITPSDFDSANDKSTTASGKLTFVDAGNPLFAGITYTNDDAGLRVMSNYFTVDISQDLSHPQLKNYFLPGIPYPGPDSEWSVSPPTSPGTVYNRGNSPATLAVSIDGVDQGYVNDLSPGGRILATLQFNPFSDPNATPANGDNPPQGTAPVPYPSWVVTGIAIAEWPLGSMAWRGCGVPAEGTATFCDALGGYRMFFAAGARDPNVKTFTGDPTGGRADGFWAGAYNLTGDGETIFMRAVDRAILQGNIPSLSVAQAAAKVTVSWNSAIRTWKLQESSDFVTWNEVSNGIENNSYSVPGALNKAKFYRLAQN